MFEIDQKTPLRKAPALTSNHVDPNTALKMKVSLAVQVFSHTTSAALSSMEDVLSPTSANTANTLRLFNDIFDFCNSRSLSEIGTRRVALRQIWVEQRAKVEEWIQKIAAISFVPIRGKRSACRMLPFKKGWLISLRAIVLLIDECFSHEEIFFVRTRRFNQDILEVRYCYFTC